MWISAFDERPRLVSDFEEICRLGKGKHSEVFCVRRRLDGAMYAVKRLKSKATNVSMWKLQAREACAHAVLTGCPFLVQYFGCWLDDKFLHIQTELCTFGSLESLLGATLFEVCATSCAGGDEITADAAASGHGSGEDIMACADAAAATGANDEDEQDEHMQMQHQAWTQLTQPYEPEQRHQQQQQQQPGSGIPEELAWVVLRDVSMAIAFMHAKGIVHLDLRPANIFISSEPRPDWFEQSQGSATPYSFSSSSSSSSFSASLSSSSSSSASEKPSPIELVQQLVAGQCSLRLGDLGQCCRVDERVENEGMDRYCPRELYNTDPNVDLCKADVFSLGATIYELLLGRELAESSSATQEWHSLRDEQLDEALLSRISPQLVSLLRQCLHPNPFQRPSASQVLASANSIFSTAASATSAPRNDFEQENQELRQEVLRLRKALGLDV